MAGKAQTWVRVESDFGTAADNFLAASEIYGEVAAVGGEPSFVEAAAIQFALVRGHTAMESGLVRIFTILDESVEKVDSWHRDLIDNAARDAPGRGPIFTKQLRDAAQTTRRARHHAIHFYEGGFDFEKARQGILAANLLAEGLMRALERFAGRMEGGGRDLR